MSRLKELREQRNAAHAKVVEFLKVEKQTAETRSSCDAALAEVELIGKDIERIEASDKIEAEMRARNERVDTAAIVADPTKAAKTPEVRAKEYRKAWADGMQNGLKPFNSARGRMNGMEQENRSIMDREVELHREAYANLPAEKRALAEGTLLSQIGTYTGIGYFVPAGFVYDVEQATKYFAPLLDGSTIRIMETATGQPLPYPISNDTTQQATIVGENVGLTEQDITAGHIDFGAYKFTSGLVTASLELLQDSAFDIEKWLVERFAERWGRGLENYLTNGTGVAQPTGLITSILASGATAIVATGSSESTGGSQTGANSIGYSDLINLEHSVDPTYRRGAKYMFHDQTLSSLKRILDKYGRPLWVPSMANNAPATINNYPYVINQSMPQISAAATTCIFGDFSKFMARKVKDLQVLRLDERYADIGQVGFVSFARLDSNLLDAGTHPLNTLIQHT
jgi:HK97 family phage major capsid protein